jgi:hypothetical protein
MSSSSGISNIPPIRLGQSDSEPIGVFVNKFGFTRYLTGNKIQEVLRSIARAVHPDLTEDEIKRFSSHSGRVWALVLLDKAGMSPAFMTSGLRWMGDSYKLYLRDTVYYSRNTLLLSARNLTKSCNFSEIIVTYC